LSDEFDYRIILGVKMKIVMFSLFSVCVVSLLLMFGGCQLGSTQSDGIYTIVKDDNVAVQTHIDSAHSKVTDADHKISAAATQPGNPATTDTLLNGAHTELSDAGDDLNAVKPLLSDVNNQSQKQSDLTKNAETKLAKERDHWIGYKGRVALWSLAGILFVLGAVYLFATFAGAGPLASAVTGVVARGAAGLINLAETVYVAIFHVVTLGIPAFVSSLKLELAKKS
jgi:hypothetical protein